jgi:hypothetical protein
MSPGGQTLHFPLLVIQVLIFGGSHSYAILPNQNYALGVLNRNSASIA